MISYAPPTDAEQLVFLKNIQRLLNEGILAAGGSPSDFQAFLTREAERWGPLLRRLNIEL